MTAHAPIGVFDSGVGGLSVLREIRALLPHEDLIYIADSRYTPYGNKSQSFIQERSIHLAGFLCRHQAKAVVIACNTATAAAAELLRGRLSVPVVGMEPAVKPAAAASRNGRIGVLATEGTLKSARFAALLSRFADGLEVHTQPCHGLVEQVEQGDTDGPVTRLLLTRYLAPLTRAGVDTIILGCTHYPFLRPAIADIVGPDIALIDTGGAVARHLRHRLDQAGLLAGRGRAGRTDVWTSGDGKQLQPVIDRLWPEQVELRELATDGDQNGTGLPSKATKAPTP
jgi:glutamate racemase